MILIIPVLLIIFALIGIRFQKHGLDNQYLSKTTTASVCGLFVIVIFVNHICRHFDCSPWYDHIATTITDTIIGNCMVVPFLFYGAYGIITQFLSKGTTYLKRFPLMRFGKVFICYLLCIGVEFFFQNISSGFTSSFNWQRLIAFDYYWFIFVILVEYFLIWITLVIFKTNKKAVLITSTISSIVFAIILSFFKGEWWYNTIIAFPLGVAVGLYKDKLDLFLAKRRRNAYIVGAISLVLWLICFLTLRYLLPSVNKYIYLVIYYIQVIAFLSGIVMFTYIFKFGNKILVTLSAYTLWVYLLQDSSYLLFETCWNVLSINKYLYVLCCIGFTAATSIILKYVFDLFDKYVLSRIASRIN